MSICTESFHVHGRGKLVGERCNAKILNELEIPKIIFDANNFELNKTLELKANIKFANWSHLAAAADD